MPIRKPLIVAVDDDARVLKLITYELEPEGYRVITARDGERGLQAIADEEPALVLLDVMMPNLDGFEVCRRVREFSDVPIVMLTARGRTEDIVNGLEAGADDYVIKPFSIDELLARMKAVLRRAKLPEEMPQPSFMAGKLCIDFSRHRVTLDGEEVVLPPTQYRVLCLLARHAGKVVTHEQILTDVWGWEYQSDSHVLQIAMNRLRKNIGDDPTKPTYIVTRSGIGYMMRPPGQGPG